MCGIAGFTIAASSPADEQTIQAMVGAIRHRGPDAQGHCRHAKAVFGHARLSIIDLSDAGTQPFHSADGRYTLVFNGEIYNYRILRDELRQAGYTFTTETDTEVVLALFILEGVGAVQRLNGMFALAFWDNHTGTLDLLRDRIGKKPLYYCEHQGELVFASELKALLQYPGLPRTLRPDAVYDYFAYQYVPDPKTIFEGMHKLEPGSHLHRDNQGRVHIQRFWAPTFGEPEAITAGQAKEQLLALLTEATEDRLISDVPLGAFLSGGVDSSGIVALMARNGRPVTTCSIGFQQKDFNETEFAQAVAQQYHTDHREHTVTDGVAERLEGIARLLDEPFADPSLVPTFFVSELARQDVTVALTGDGGDELFAGYAKYQTDWQENRLRRRFPHAARALMGQLAPSVRRLPSIAARKASSLMHSLSLNPAQAFYVTNTFLDDQLWAVLLNDGFRRQLGDYHPSELTLQRYRECASDDHLAKILYTDMTTYLPGGILVKADRMSMANALELRSPLLDYRVIEFANRLPSELKFHRGDKKRVLREALEPLLPPHILNRRKMGFSTPLAHWLRTELKPLAEHYLLDSAEGLPQLFDPKAIHQLWQQHQISLFDHSALLWSLLMFELWWQNYMSQPGSQETQTYQLNTGAAHGHTVAQ
ncbi:MAG: asparagine synthase (glutamine-hydrolyzing) [Saccharospirillum sp.]